MASNSSNVGGVNAGQARHNSSNVGGVTAGQIRHNSSIGKGMNEEEGRVNIAEDRWTKTRFEGNEQLIASNPCA